MCLTSSPRIESDDRVPGVMKQSSLLVAGIVGLAPVGGTFIADRQVTQLRAGDSGLPPLTSDPAGTVQAEVECVAGTGSQTGGGGRWGDYSSTSLDPSDECTFWTAQEYVETTGSFQWNTRICSFSFPSCAGGGPVFTLSSAVPAIAGQSNTWTTTNGTPSRRHLLFFGQPQGSTQVNVGQCVGVTIDLGNARQIANAVANASGSAAISRSVPVGAAGKNRDVGFVAGEAIPRWSNVYFCVFKRNKRY